MSFTNIQTALGWAELPATAADGLFLQPEEATTIDGQLGSAAATQAELATANTTIGERDATITGLQNQLTAAQNANTALTTERDNLQAEVIRLGGQSSGQGSATVTAADAKIAGSEKRPSYLADNNPSNEWIDKQLKYAKKKD